MPLEGVGGRIQGEGEFRERGIADIIALSFIISQHDDFVNIFVIYSVIIISLC